MLLKNALVFIEGRFQLANIEVEGSTFSNITKIDFPLEDKNSNSPDKISSESKVIDCSNEYIIPGCIDIHSHGCIGYDFINATEEEIQEMCNFYASKGITSILSTTMTIDLDTHKKAMKTIDNAMKNNLNGSRILGINMEGPFLGKDKRGAHDPKYLTNVEEDVYEDLMKASNYNIRIIDIDPTLPGAMEFIKKYKDDITISLAHTSSTYDKAMEAFEAGASHVTHLFNAMNGLHHREPGIVGAFCDCKDHVRAELICDGVHVHPSVVRLIYKANGENLILISDSMCAAGVEDGIYELGGQKVIVKDRKATLEDGTIAGSTVNVYEAMKRAIQYGIPMEQAILSATKVAAQSMKLEDKVGSIAVGQFADFLITDKDLNIKRIFIGGKEFKA